MGSPKDVTDRDVCLLEGNQVAAAETASVPCRSLAGTSSNEADITSSRVGF